MAGPRLGCTHERGRAARAELRKLIRNAPPNGLRVAELAAAIGAIVEKARWHLKQMPEAIQAPTKAMRFRNWFHVSQQAQCDAYTRATDEQPVISGPSMSSRELVLQAITASGSLGLSQVEMCEATGFSMGTLWAILPQMLRDQKVERDRDLIGKSANSKRYWALGKKPISSCVAVQVVQPKQLARRSRNWNGVGLNEAKPQAPQIVVTQPVDYSRAKVTQCPSCHDMRHTVHKPEPFFSRPGYRPDFIGQDTWTARVYGGAR